MLGSHEKIRIREIAKKILLNGKSKRVQMDEFFKRCRK